LFEARLWVARQFLESTSRDRKRLGPDDSGTERSYALFGPFLRVAVVPAAEPDVLFVTERTM